MTCISTSTLLRTRPTTTTTKISASPRSPLTKTSPFCFLRALQRRCNPIPATAGPVSFLTNLALTTFGIGIYANFDCSSLYLRAASTTAINTQPWLYLIPTPQASFVYYLGSGHAILVKFLTTILSLRKLEGS
ncbi:hypothetical protein PS1_044580 [Malus domestica]